MARLSVIVPVLNEADGIAASLAALAPLRERGAELIVADGGSQDDTVTLARPLADQVVVAPRGRAAQMNAGAAVATGDMLLFLHVDTQLPPDAGTLIAQGLKQSGHAWGRFDVRIDGTHFLLPVIAAMMNTRSRLTGIATGDQAVFVSREAFQNVGGFPDLPLMEDIALSKRLKRLGRPLCLRARVTTSGRRWERHGVARTIMLMWRLRLAYWLGADPAELAKQYGYRPRT
ncbi:MAG: glycosyl transferase [Xanthobacteraceae bacterium]|jgi:rSAM/selenodomain-associated transferase 2|nr:glycosyl transferase [Xanthobacteraceae bacterium]